MSEESINYNEIEDLDYCLDLLEKRDKEIERLNNIIEKLERLVDDYAWNGYYIKCGNRYLKSEILNDIREIIELKGSDKE